MVVTFSLERPQPWPAAGRVTEAPPDLLIMRPATAVYPEEAMKQKIHGEVPVRLTLDAQGKVTDAKVLGGPEPLRNAALEAARQWRFARSTHEPCETTVTFNFLLPEDLGPGKVTYPWEKQ